MMVKARKGSAIVIGLVAAAVLLALLAAVAPMVTQSLHFQGLNKDAVDAQYAAEAGAKRAISAIRQGKTSWSWLGAAIRFPVSDAASTKTYIVTISPAITNGSGPAAGQRYTIKSNGYVGKWTKTVTVQVDTPQAGSSAKTIPAYPAYIGSLSAVSLSGANADIYTGEAFPPALITQTQYKRLGNQTIAIPSYDFAAYKAAAQPLPTIVMNQNYLTSGSGLYYYDAETTDPVNKTLTITQNNAQIIGKSTGSVIFVKGSLTFAASAGGMNISNGQIFIIATGDITINNNANFSGVVLLAGGNITFNGSLLMQPGIIATPKKLTVTSSTFNLNTSSSEATTLANNFNTIMSKYATAGSGSGSGSGSSSEVTVHDWSNI